MKQKKYSIPLIISTGICCLLLVGLLALWYRPRTITMAHRSHQKWTTVFVHGSFNFPLSLLNAMNLFSDTIENTTYAQVINRLRKEPFFQQEQPILNQGLIKIDPNFSCPDTEYKFAAYPIITSYETVQNALISDRVAQDFYTFGWSGLLSQRQRRHEAVRLYNALSEIAHNPIRLISHSHGGNVCLNLALVNKARELIDEANQTKLMQLRERKDSLSTQEHACLAMVDYLEQLPTKASVDMAEHETDYQPQGPQLDIAQLITLGNPIQEETAWLYGDATFSHAINVYSPNDNVQGSDRISTSTGWCAQRLPDTIEAHNTLTQVKLMVDHTLSTTEHVNSSYLGTLQHLWHLLSGQDDPQVLPDHSPTHKDLWFFGWSPEYCQTNSPLYPLPAVILLPLVMNLVEQIQSNDVEVNIQFLAETIRGQIHQHGQPPVLATTDLSQNIFADIKEKCLAWKPHNLSKENLFHTIHTNL